jgi:hypothetical protein
MLMIWNILHQINTYFISRVLHYGVRLVTDYVCTLHGTSIVSGEYGGIACPLVSTVI